MNYIHREGYKIILTAFIVLSIINLAVLSFGIAWLSLFTHLLTLIVFVLIVQFFRNPKRIVTAKSNEIVAHADGKIVIIEEVEEPEYFKTNEFKYLFLCRP